MHPSEHGDKGDLILIPQPSSDPEDPLNWSRRRKALSTTCNFLFVFIAGTTTSCLSPALGVIVAETGIPLANLNTGSGIMYLFMGWSNLIVQSFALNYGRRSVLLLSAICATGCALWTPYVSSTGEWYANRLILGAVLGPVESLSEITFTDVQFSHNRGFYLAVYNWALWNMPFIAPIAAGFVTDRYGWQWIQYIVTIVCAAVCIFLFLFLEQTMYYREQIPEELLDDQSDKTVPSNGSTRGEVTIVEPTQKDSKTVSDVVTSDIADGSTNYVPRTFFQKIKLWGHRDPRQPNTLVEDFYLPFILVRFPATVFGGLLVGGSLSWLNVVNGTIALVLGSAPYHFSTNMIGVACLSCVIGVSAGCLLGGWVSDKFAEGMARRNKGVREPEHRLWMALLPLILHPAGCILYGVGAFHEIHWVGVLFGLGLIAFCLPMGANIAFNYVLDIYKEIGGQAMVTCILFRNTMGFGFAFAVVPMIDSLGLQYTFITLGFLGFAFWFMCVFMIFFGKALRAKTAPEYWKLVERRGAVAH